MSERLHQEIDRLADWVIAHGPDEYPYSGDLYAAVESLLDNPPLSDNQVCLLLDALALDDEAEIVQDSLHARPIEAIQVACAGIRHLDNRARWQAAMLSTAAEVL